MDGSTRIALALLSLGIVAACSDPPPPPAEVVPEDRPTPAPDPEEEPEATADPAEPPPVALELPETLPAPSALRQRREVHGEEGNPGFAAWPVIDHPDRAVAAVINGTLASVARELADFGGYGGDCEAHLANEHLVSAICGTMYDTRGGQGRVAVALHFAVAEGRVHPVALADAFLPGADIDALARAQCMGRSEAEAARLPEDQAWDLDGGCDYLDIAFGPEGLALIETSWTGASRRAAIPYAELRDQIRAGGPLAPVLGGGPARFAVIAPEEATGWAVTRFGSTSGLVRRWMDLDPARVGGLAIDDFGGGLARLVLPGREVEARARDVARALGEEATPVRLGAGPNRLGRLSWDDWDVRVTDREAATVRWVRTTEDLNLWRPQAGEQRGRALVAVIPAGSLVAAVGGALRQRGGYVEVVTAFGGGLLASLHLRENEGCVLAPGPTGRHVARVSVRERGSSRDAWLVIERRGAGSHVSLHAREGEICALGEELLAVDVDRPAFDVRLGATDARGGTTLLVIGARRARGSEDMRYRVFRIGSRGPVLDETLVFDREDADGVVRVGETVEGTYYPLTLGSGSDLRRYTYLDGGLVEAAPPG